MTQKDRGLLLKDLCARLPYGVLVHYTNKKTPVQQLDFTLNERIFLEFRTYPFNVELKPYLRPISSMTGEEWKDYQILKITDWVKGDINEVFINAGTITDWLNAHHFDYRKLIEKGLAIEVTKENNPYKN